MIRVLAFAEETLAGPEAPEVPALSNGSGPQGPELLVGLDPTTGNCEILFDHAMFFEPEGLLGRIAARREPVERSVPTRPFRATVVPRRLRGLDDRPPILPGAGATGCRGAPRPRLAADAREIGSRAARPELVLTDFPVRVTSTGAQPLELAQDVLDADELTLELRVLALTAAAGGPDVTVEIQTGMQLESSVGWVSAGAFARVTGAPSAEVKTFGSLLRYVRWSVSGLTGTSATFFVSGVARRWAKGA